MSTMSSRARDLRNHMTAEERKLWYLFLRPYAARFRRQMVIGPYIADFYCSQARLVIELDGSQHYEQKSMGYDEVCTEYLHSIGIRVLRFSNADVNKNFPAVCQSIELALKQAGVPLIRHG